MNESCIGNRLYILMPEEVTALVLLLVALPASGFVNFLATHLVLNILKEMFKMLR